ncbi:MAG: NUDIX hydrolase [Verrucomicrobia bacterium]|nr:NUDIX hydrolase [Verrucomicrobiota bacterium]
MQRQQIIKLLELYTPIDPDEISYKKQMLSFIKDHPNCFERSLEIGHITASCWLLDSTKTKALLLHHAKLDIWCQPGGHADGNSDVLFTALKEAKEEVGIEKIIPLKTTIFDIDIHSIPAKGSISDHLHYDVRFLLQIASEERPSLNQESKDFLWVDKSPSSIPTQERSILRMWEKWINL